MPDNQLRFEFGKNWSQFLKNLNPERIQEAEKSLVEKLGISDLKGLTFLDAGCGSGLFSLVAHRLGATVVSFDYDENSVKCAEHLKETYAHDHKETWQVMQGDVLDNSFLEK